MDQQYIINDKKPFFTPSRVLGMISAILLLLGLLLPAMDFSRFHEKVDIQYNLIKICKNVGLISGMWMGIPYAIMIGIVAMAVLSFVRIPILKLIPCLLIAAMFVLMIADSQNVVEWVSGVLDKYFANYGIAVTAFGVFKSFMAGIYLLAAGFVTGLVSCFMKE